MSDLSYCSVQKLAEDLAIVGARRYLAVKAGRSGLAVDLAETSDAIRRELSLIPTPDARRALELDSILALSNEGLDLP